MKTKTVAAFLCFTLLACGVVAKPVIKVEKKPWGADYTLVSSQGTQDVVLVSVKPKCVKYASVMANMYSDDEYGVGVRAWDLRDEMVQKNGELKVIVPGGRAGATASVIEGPRNTLAERFAAAGHAHGAAMNDYGGPNTLSSDGARLSYMFAEVTTASCEDYIELAFRGGQGIIHFHGWWSALGHYPVNLKYFPGGFTDLTNAAAKVHAAGLKVGMHTLSGCVDFRDSCLSTKAVRDLQHIVRYTLAADLDYDATEMTVLERPDPRHDRVMTYSGNGNVLRLGDELVQYDDFTLQPPYKFKGLKRRWLGSQGSAHKAGSAADYLRQRYLSFYPEPGSALADSVADSIANMLNACKADQVYFDGSEGMGTRYNIDWMRNRIFRGIGRSVMVEASHNNAHNWYFHSRLFAWDYPSWNLNAFNDLHVRRNSAARSGDLLMPQMGWWAPLGSRPHARAHLREEMEYCAGKTAALDASFAIAGVEEAFGPPSWRALEHLTVLGWYEGLRCNSAFSKAAIDRLAVPGDEYRLRANDEGQWRLRRVYRSTRRIAGNEGGRWSVKAQKASPVSLRVESLFDADKSSDKIVLLPAGGGSKKNWKYPYFNIKDHSVFVFDVKGDGSGRTLVLCVKSPREFTSATSEHRVKIDFTGWRRITVLARERDAAPDQPLSLRYTVYRNRLRLDRISEVSLRWDDDANAKLPEVGDVVALAMAKVTDERPKMTLGERTFEIPFNLQSGEFTELEGGWWTHYSEQGQPIARTKGPQLSVAAGENALVWDSKCRAEVVVTMFGDEIDALKKDALMPEYLFAMPSRYAPSCGFDSPVSLTVAQGERRQVRLELLGEVDRPVVSVGGVSVEFPVKMHKGDRLLCRGGSEWLLRDSKRKTLASGKLERPLPVITSTTKVTVSSTKPDSADVRVLLSTRRVAD